MGGLRLCILALWSQWTLKWSNDFRGCNEAVRPGCATQWLQGTTYAPWLKQRRCKWYFQRYLSKTWVGIDNLDPLSKFWSSVSGCGIIPACAQGHKGGKPPWKISSPTLSEAGHNPILNYLRKAVLIWGEKRTFAREIFSGRSYTIATRKVIVGHRLVFVPMPFTEQA